MLCLLVLFFAFLDVPFRAFDILSTMTSKYVTLYLTYEVSQEEKACTKFLNQHNFICSKFYKLDKEEFEETKGVIIIHKL